MVHDVDAALAAAGDLGAEVSGTTTTFEVTTRD